MLVELLLDVLPFITMAPTVSLFYQYCGGGGGTATSLVEVLVVVLSFITMT